MKAGNPKGGANAPPLVVDLDGSLVNGDLLVEGAAQLIARAPRHLFLLPCWLLASARGGAALKRRIAQAAPLPPETLSLNPAVLEEIDAAKAGGREVWLATAADELAAAPLVERIGAAGCIASDGRVNLAGSAKAAVLVERFGQGGFDYIGNERRDLKVWKRSRRAMGVGLSSVLKRKVLALDSQARFLPVARGGPLDHLRALRPHQWVKNLLVFMPLIAAHEAGAFPYLAAAGAFAALSACASGGYLCNDLLDLPHDRRHPTKRHRPLAAGGMPPRRAICLGAALMVGGLALAFWLSVGTGLCTLLYLVASLAYSLLLKRKLFVDVIGLAALYASRVLTGGVVAEVPLSPWFLSFFLFAFLALAVAKRQNELRKLSGAGQSESGGRAYLAEDLAALAAIGAASAMTSALVFLLYVQQAPAVHYLYAQPQRLWLIFPLVIYLLGRMTLLANRGEIGDDPVLFALRDRASWLAGLGILAVFVAAL